MAFQYFLLPGANEDD